MPPAEKRCHRCRKRFLGVGGEVADLPSSPFSEDENGNTICRECTMMLWGGESNFRRDARDTTIVISAITIAETCDPDDKRP